MTTRRHLSYEQAQQMRFAADASVSTSRRQFLKSTACTSGGLMLGALGGGALLGTPRSAGAQATISEVGLTLSLDPRIIQAYQTDTGNTLKPHTDVLGGLQTYWLQNYRNFDLINTNFNQIAPLVHEGTFRAVDAKEVPAWNENVTPLFREVGSPGHNSRSGWPLAGVYSASEVESGNLQTFQAGVPNWYGFDAFGYVEGKAGGDLESYGAIFAEENQGHAALLNEPITSVMKVATYLQGSGQAEFEGTLSNLSKSDLGVVFDFLGEQKERGQFRLFWSDFGQLVDLLVAEEVWVGDFWASAVAAARGEGANVVFVNNPKEGSNGWIHGSCISSESENVETAIEYQNWWLESGVPGAVLAVQGYYSPRPDRVKEVLDDQSTTVEGVSDWDYWYDGARPEERPALQDRLGNVADWQQFPENFSEYSRLWTQFVAA